ncbi:MAG: energy transducer TonB [Fibrobacteraceae bacterium]|nr:energy transducer TonB [Fibrobacteraceae bacterium]
MRLISTLFHFRWLLAVVLAIVVNSFFFLAIPVLNVLVFRSDVKPQKPQVENLMEVESLVKEKKKTIPQKAIRQIVLPNHFKVNNRMQSGMRSRSSFQMDLSLARGGDGSGDGVAVGGEEGVENVVYEAGDVDEEARALKEVNPSYPDRAKKLGVAGYVKVYLVIDVYGNVSEAHVLTVEPAGYGFEAEALKAIRSWKFEPAKLGHYPVAQKATKEFKFVP